jgi:hypothetical protein
MRSTFAEDIRMRPTELLNELLPAAIELLAQVKAPCPDRPSASTDAGCSASEPDDRIGTWVYEGGAGDDVKR